MQVFSLGERCPVEASEGLQIITGEPPILIFIGIPSPTRAEVQAIRDGKILHGFGVIDYTAWLSLQFHDLAGTAQFQGEVFHTACKEPDQFTDNHLAALRAKLRPGIGIACSIILVNTNNQRIFALRHYAWSTALSLAYINAAEKTRSSTIEAANKATDELLTYSTTQLMNLGTTKFEVSGAK